MLLKWRVFKSIKWIDTMSHLPVLIVGAGPTGLMMACELVRFGVSFRIIDKKSEPTKGSNATWIQPRTLEIFDFLSVTKEFLKIGQKCHAINFYAEGKEVAKLSLAEINSLYAYILLLPQTDTERLLENKLKESNVRVERSHELIDIQQSNDGVIATIKLQDGTTEVINADWVMACDGAKSTVREKCQMTFPGEDVPEQFMVADAIMSSFLPADQMHVFVDKGTILKDKGTVFCAFPCAPKQYRLMANLYQQAPRQTFYEHEVKEVVAERTYGNYVVESVSWISPFWIHGKIIDHMREGAIFFLGDAAHIHSPAGGQGMNSGIQDAFNLAWKLASVIQKKAKPILLDSFQKERYPILKEALLQNDFYTNMFLFDKSFFSKLTQFGEKLTAYPRVAKKYSEALTQLSICYDKSPVMDYQHPVDANSPKVGERAPNAKINAGKTLYQYLQNTHHILIFINDQENKDILFKIDALDNMLKSTFKDQVVATIITREKSTALPNALVDENGEAARVYNIDQTAVYIVRPDNYLSYYSQTLDTGEIEKYLQTYLSASKGAHDNTLSR